VREWRPHVARTIDEDELIEHWTMIGDELGQVAGERGTTRLGLALLLEHDSPQPVRRLVWRAARPGIRTSRVSVLGGRRDRPTCRG
jgi:hypothetical protein